MKIPLQQFTPIGKIFVQNLGLQDKNNNGLIEKGKGEGYEEFIEKYGNADKGFTNFFGRVLEKDNGQLCEKEIMDYYYLNIRFNFSKETTKTDEQLKTYIIDNHLPKVWIDEDRNGNNTPDVAERISQILPQKPVTLDTAAEELPRLFMGLGLLPELKRVTTNYFLNDTLLQRKYQCVESANFAFYILSLNQISSLYIGAVQANASSISKAKLHIFNYISKNNTYLDLSKFMNNGQDTQGEKYYLYTLNPIEVLANYYYTEYLDSHNLSTLEQAVALDPDRLERVLLLATIYANDGDLKEAAVLGSSVSWQFAEGVPANQVYEEPFRLSAESFVQLAKSFQ